MKYLIILLFLNFTYFVFSQDTITTYYDSKWKEVSKENAKYYRIATKGDKKQWNVKDYFMNGKIQMEGTYQTKKMDIRIGHFTYYFENGFKSSEGDFLKNKFNGEWTWYHENGKVSTKEIYSKDELIDIQCWDENSEKQEENCKPDIFPEFIGGNIAYTKFFNENLKFPQVAIDTYTKGIVKVKFAIDKDGTVKEAVVVESVDPIIEKEALRVVNLMPKWKPGKSHNRVEKMYCTIPVRFKFEL